MKKRVLSLFLAITLCLSLTPTGALAEESLPGQTVVATQETETPTPAPQKEEPLPEQTVAATQETETPTPAPQKEESTAPAENGADENASPASPDEKPTENTPAAPEKNPADEEPGKEAGQNEPTAEGKNEPLALGLDDAGQNAAEGENGEGSGGTHYVAESGGTQYETVQEILDNTEEGEITLLGNVTEDLTVYAATTIHMNGHSITGKIDATDSLTLNGGTVDGTVTVNATGGTFTMTAPAEEEAAITGWLNVVSGSAFVSGAQVGVKGTLYFDGTDMLISGAVKAVELDSAAEPAAKTLYGSATVNGDTAAEAGFDTDTYKVGGEIAKKLTNKQVGSTTPAAPSLTLTETSKSLTAGKTAVFTANYTGTDTLNAYVQGSAVNGYFTISQKNNGDGTYTVSVKIDEETPGGTYMLFVHELGNTSVQASATITVTGLPDAAEVNGKQYKSLPRALDAAQDGDTVKLLANHTTNWDNVEAGEYATLAVVKKTLTLDLNLWTVDYLVVGEVVPDEAGGILESTDGNLTVVDNIQGGSHGKIKDLEFVQGSLAIQGGQIGDSDGSGLTCDGNSGTVTISGGTVCNVTVGDGAAVTVTGGTGHAGGWYNDGTLNITDGTFGNVRFRNNGGTIAISGGTFGTITNINGSSSIPLMPLLADNYAFYQGDNAQNSTEKTLTNVTVRPHTHSFENGKCDCGASYVASVTTSNGVTNNYTSLDDALDAAKDGDTVTLLGDAEVTKWHSLSKAFTLELNGKTVTTQSKAELYLHARVIVQDSSTGKTGGMAGTALLNVQEGGDLIIKSGTFNGRITINVGKLTIKGGTFNQEVDLRRGDSDSVFFSGGTFAKIWYPNSSGSFLDLLADGCAFYDNDGKLVNVAEITDTNLYNVRIRPHQHTFTNGACGCGYACPHTSVDESGACTVCGKQFAASITEGNDVTYYDLFNDALVYAFNNDGCTLKLLADVTGTTVMINNPFLFDLNGHNVDALSVDARATIKDSGTTKGRIGKVTVSNEKVTDLTLGDLLEEGYAFKYGNGYWANDSYLQTTEGSFVTVEKAPIQSVNVYAKDKNNQEILTIAYGATGEVTLVSSCTLSETSGADLTYLWYKLEGAAATAPLEGATGANYTLPDNLAAGTHTYLLICTSDGYSKSAEITITVTPISLVGVTVTVSNLTYNGNPQEPTVTVKFGDETLSRDNDYTVQVTQQTDAGSYKLTIKGGGNYSGEIKDVEWKIEPMKIDSVMVSSDISKVYDGTAEINMTAEEWAKVLTFKTRSAYDVVSVPSDAYTISDAYFVKKSGEETIYSPDAGEKYGISFKITLKSNNYVLQNYYDEEPATAKEYTQSGGATFAIAQADAPTNIRNGALNVINGTTLEYTYDAKQILPAAPNGTYGTVLYSGEPSSDFESGYTVNSFKVGINSGVLTLTIDAQNGGKTGKIGSVTIYVTTDNYESFDLPLDLYAVDQIKPEPDGTITATPITYGDTLSKSKISGKMKDLNTGDAVNGTFAWTDGTIKPAASDNYEAEWTFTPAAGYEKYATATGTVTIKVNKATPTFTAPTAQENLTYTGQEQALITAGSVTSGGTMQYSLTENGTYSPDTPTGTDAGAYTVWYRVIGDANHNDTAPASVAVSIRKKPLTITGVTAASKPYDGTKDAGITSVTFDGVNLNRGTDYTVTANFDDAGVGKSKNVTATVTLMGQAAKNYALEQSSFTATGSITKVAAPDSDLHPAVTVINDLAKTYEMVLSNDYLPKLSSPCEYGNVSYSLRGTYLTDGYKDTVQVKVMEENGQYKLKLTVPAVDYNKVSSVGTIDVRVTSDNYRDFYLTIGVKTKNKDVPVPDGTISASDITYGQALNDSKIAGKMKAGGKAIDGTFTWTNGTFKPAAGDYPASWTFTPAKGYEEYATATGTATVTVDPKAVTVSITPNGGTYGSVTAAAAVLSGVVDGETVPVTLTYTGTANDGTEYTGTTPPTKAGTYTVTAATTDTNYTLDAKTTTAEFTVAKRRATVTPDNKSKVYEEKDPKLTYIVSGVLSGETLKGITLARAEGENAGKYAITATADVSANPNYDVTFAEGTFTIEPKSIKGATVVLGKGLIANGAEQTQTVEKVLLGDKEIPADSYTVTGNTATTPDSHTLTITAKGNYTGTVKQTYVIIPAKAEDAPDKEITIGNGKVNVKFEGTVPPATRPTDKAELLAMLVDNGDITADELAQIAHGANVNIVLTVKEANVSAEIKTAMAQAAKGYTIGQYLDISLLKYMTVNGIQQADALPTTKDALTISVGVPDALINTNSAVNRTYCIVRNHKGTIDVLDAAFDAAGKTLTFKTDRFSIYAIAYKDTAVPSSGSNPGSNNSSNDSETKKNEVAAPTPAPTPASTSKPSTITAMPQTGDTSNPTLYVVLLVASLLGLAVVFVCKKRNDK